MSFTEFVGEIAGGMVLFIILVAMFGWLGLLAGGALLLAYFKWFRK